MRLRTGYYRMPSLYANEADVIFVPTFTRGLSTVELATWGQRIGYGQLEYQPARAIKEEPNAAAQA